MYSLRWLMLALIALLLGALGATHVTATPTGAQRIFMPHIGRAEPIAADFVGLFFSRYPGYPATPEPVSEIYTVRGDGSDYARLTNNNVYDLNPVWSPDGSMILWRQTDAAPGGDATFSDLWLMNSDGSNQRPVTTMEGGESGSWSPDGSQIGFFNNSNFYLTTPTTITPTLVMTNALGVGEIWSPTGDYIALTAPVGENIYDIYRLDSDGGNPTLLAEDMQGDFSGFHWSPDGEWIVYPKIVEGNQDLYAVRVDGSETRRLTTDPAVESFTAWVEDGARLLVQRIGPDQASMTDLVTFADGTSTPFITEGIVNVWSVSPNGKMVAYSGVDSEPGTHTFYVQATDSMTPTAVSEPMPCSAACGFAFNGWSADSQQLSYTFYWSPSPSLNYQNVYVASLAGDTPTYELLTNNLNISGAKWLPYGNWLASYLQDDSGTRLTVLNTRTDAEYPLPTAEDGFLLIPVEWRYEP